MTYSDILLHTHLEGSIPYEALVKICDRNSIASKSKSWYCLYKQKNGLVWGDFREKFSSICNVLLYKEDFYDLVVEYGKKLKTEGVNYVEYHFSPWKHLERGVRLSEIEKGLFDGMKYLAKEIGLKSCLIVDFVRKEKEQIDYIFDWALSCSRNDVVAIGVSGGIPSIERYNYRLVTEKAKKNGFFVVAHAGEMEAPSSILDAIENLNPDRIAHGIKCVLDNNIIELILKKGIHLEICPTANNLMGIVGDDYKEIKLLLDSGISFSINTDDELIFNTNLCLEYDCLLKCGVINHSNVLNIIENTEKSSFLLNKMNCLK